MTKGGLIYLVCKQRRTYKSEYVLVGTMLSYCLAIVVGVFINYLIVKCFVVLGSNQIDNNNSQMLGMSLN